MVRAKLKGGTSPIDTAQEALKPVIAYVQAVKNGVPIGIVAQALVVRDCLEKAR